MNVPRQNPATDYRRQAEAVRAVANSVSLNDVRREFLETVRRLEALAEEEERNARHSASGEHHRPSA